MNGDLPGSWRRARTRRIWPVIRDTIIIVVFCVTVALLAPLWLFGQVK